MAWQDTIVPMLRVLINDLDSTSYSYSDDRLEEIVVVAAQLVAQEINFDTTYTVNVPLCTISPDPVANSDDAFTNFITLKAACFMDQSQFRTKATVAGLKAKVGPAVLETTEHLKGFKELLNIGPCAAYKTLKEEWVFGNAQVVEAVLSPFISNNFDPADLPSSTVDILYSQRGRYM